MTERNLQDLPVIVCGDFNSTPNTASIHCMHDQKFDENSSSVEAYQTEKGRKIYKIVEENSKDCPKIKQIAGTLASAYQNYNVEPDTEKSWAENMVKCHPPHTMYLREFKGTVDWVFYSKQKLNLVGRLDMPLVADLEEDGAQIPSKLFPSDHLRIGAVFELQSK